MYTSCVETVTLLHVYMKQCVHYLSRGATATSPSQLKKEVFSLMKSNTRRFTPAGPNRFEFTVDLKCINNLLSFQRSVLLFRPYGLLIIR